jgi:hypothetical protein
MSDKNVIYSQNSEQGPYKGNTEHDPYRQMGFIFGVA